MTALKKCVLSSVILAAISFLFQTISFVIPGWFITETRKLSVNMALWYVIVCNGEHDNRDICNTITYKSFYSGEKRSELTDLAGLSVLSQMIGFIIPGWFIMEMSSLSVNMAVWYVILCDGEQNKTQADSCESVTYKELFSGQNGDNLAQLGAMFTSVVGTQVQVTACLILAASALLLILFQFKTFHQQTPGQPSIFVDEPRGTCNVRAKFIYSGGFSAIFQLFSGLLLGLVIIDFGKKYYALGKPRPAIPYTLFIAGIGASCSGLCGIIELAIAFRTKENSSRRSSGAEDKHCQPHQLIPLNQVQGQGHHHHHHHYDKQARTVSLDDGDYYGQDYDVENPAFHTQGGRKSDASSSLFPGYRLGRQNLQGHDKKWWRKVTFAAFTVL